VRSISYKDCRGKQNKHFTFNNVFLKIISFVR